MFCLDRPFAVSNHQEYHKLKLAYHYGNADQKKHPHQTVYLSLNFVASL
jgi:hypothetical protein